MHWRRIRCKSHCGQRAFAHCWMYVLFIVSFASIHSNQQLIEDDQETRGSSGIYEMRGKEMENASILLMESLSRLWDRISSEEKILSKLCGLETNLRILRTSFVGVKTRILYPLQDRVIVEYFYSVLRLCYFNSVNSILYCIPLV